MNAEKFNSSFSILCGSPFLVVHFPMNEKVNILLVDDKPEKLLSLEAVLEDLDQNIVRAYNGREGARKSASTEEFAAVILDG